MLGPVPQSVAAPRNLINRFCAKRNILAPKSNGWWSTVISFQFNEGNATLIFLLADFARNGVADIFKAGKIPEIRKFPAFLRLHWLDGAVVAFEEDAGAVRIFLERQATAIGAQLGELLDEMVLAHALESGEP